MLFHMKFYNASVTPFVVPTNNKMSLLFLTITNYYSTDATCSNEITDNGKQHCGKQSDISRPKPTKY